MSWLHLPSRGAGVQRGTPEWFQALKAYYATDEDIQYLIALAQENHKELIDGSTQEHSESDCDSIAGDDA